MAGDQGKSLGMISLSVAMDPNKGIGLRGNLPWHIRDELKIFKRNTLNKNVLMGKTTYEGLPGKLKDRNIYVVSSSEDYQPEDVTVIHDLLSFLKEHQEDEEEYIVCGGASIYAQAYPYVSRAYVSFIRKDYETDTSFEVFDKEDWDLLLEEEHEEFIYCELKRKGS